MKCEIKCIKNDFKEDCRTLGLRAALIITLISFLVITILRELLGASLCAYVSMAIALAAFVYFILLGYFTWKDAAEYCKNRKIKTQEIHHG